MVILHEDFDKYAIWENGTVVGLKKGATENAKEAYSIFKQLEMEQAEENKKAKKYGRYAKRIF